ncbi:MAG TPA: hypothetical protein VMM84_03345, partial [Pyrinomonadaceae bacterium]|nr:hypothetical protein [Pyrinomonadaceae bacterium]
VLQSYFDEELSTELRKDVASHLARCAKCAASAAELESENLLLASALVPEFELPVPTERLRQRVDAAIAGSEVVSPTARQSAPGRPWIESFAALFNFAPQQAFGYAGLMAVLAFASIFAIVKLRNPEVSAPGGIAETVANNKSPEETSNEVDPRTDDSMTASGIQAPEPPPSRQPRKAVKRRSGPSSVAREVRLLPGERSYLKTIAALDDSIRANPDSPMRPALQAEYERNLALVDRALAAARTAAKSNPNDPLAAEFMFAAYQSKVDLLNTVADARMYNRR